MTFEDLLVCAVFVNVGFYLLLSWHYFSAKCDLDYCLEEIAVRGKTIDHLQKVCKRYKSRIRRNHAAIKDWHDVARFNISAMQITPEEYKEIVAAVRTEDNVTSAEVDEILKRRACEVPMIPCEPMVLRPAGKLPEGTQLLDFPAGSIKATEILAFCEKVKTQMGQDVFLKFEKSTTEATDSQRPSSVMHAMSCKPGLEPTYITSEQEMQRFFEPPAKIDEFYVEPRKSLKSAFFGKDCGGKAL